MRPLNRSWRVLTCLSISLALPSVVDAQSASDRVVAVMDGVELTADDLDRTLAGRALHIESQLYVLARLALDELIAERLYKAHARTMGVSTTELDRQLDARIPVVTDQEVRLVYDAMPDRYPDLTEAQALEAIRESMRLRRAREKRLELIAELRSATTVKVLLQQKRVDVSLGSAHTIGPADAPVTLVEFGDYQCPFCRQLAPILKEVMARFPGKVRFAYRDMPLPNHPHATSAAEAARCAGEQGATSYWRMHDLLFENQRTVGAAFYVRAAKEIGLDESRFTECLASRRHEAGWQQDLNDAKTLGLSGTPVIFVNGRPFTGVVPLSILQDVVREEILAAESTNRPTDPARKEREEE